MSDMLFLLAAYVAYASPALLAAVWAWLSPVQQVRRLMRWTAMIHFAVVTAMFLYSFVVDWLCDGSALKGYVSCRVIPVEWANQTLPIFVVSVAALTVWALLVIVLCTFMEVKSFRARRLT